jgi:hypothetical protein
MHSKVVCNALSWRLHISRYPWPGPVVQTKCSDTNLSILWLRAYSSVYNNPALAGCIPKELLALASFELVVYNTPEYTIEDAESFYLSSYKLERNKGPLQGTKITGLCA